jgi:predicted TIM-barrel fold metal-dependent hydrolase
VDSQLNPLTRRGALKTAGAAAVAATTAALARPGPATAGGRGAGGRVDTHHHAVPEDMWRWAVDNGLLPPTGGPTWAHWRVEDALAVMADNDIAAAVVSAPVPAVVFEDRALAEDGVRVCNESYAQLVADHPGRFGFFANVAPLHTDLALAQVAYAFDDLGADGVILMASAGGRYLGDPVFDPLFAELNRRRAVVFIHPDGLPDGDVEIPGIDEFIADFLLDTTRSALSLVAAGTLERYPDLSIILAHAGGFLPYAAGRVASAGRQGEGPDPAVVRAAVRRFYYDTAMPMSPYATPSLLAAAGADRILYGTDYAARPAEEVGVITGHLDRDRALDRRGLAAINRGNALRLFPKLAARVRD